jgi:hypothetical protein
VTVTGDVALVAVNDPGLDVTVKDAGTPPVAFAVTATVAAPLLKARDDGVFVAVPIVGVSGTSGTFVPPADASLYFLPERLESLALLIAITKSRFQTQKMIG